MDRGAWRATVHGVTEHDMTELLTHTKFCCPLWLCLSLQIPHTFRTTPGRLQSMGSQRVGYDCVIKHPILRALTFKGIFHSNKNTKLQNRK